MVGSHEMTKTQYIFQSKEWLLAQPTSTALIHTAHFSFLLSTVTFTASSHGTVSQTQKTIRCESDHRFCFLRAVLSTSLGITSCFPGSTAVCPFLPFSSLSATKLKHTLIIWRELLVIWTHSDNFLRVFLRF